MNRKDFTVNGREGETLSCSRFLPPTPNTAFPTAFLFHGYASSRFNSTNSALIEPLTQSGIAVVLTDLSGHGESSGSISNQNVLKARDEIIDVVAHCLHLAEINEEKYVLLGNSFSGNACILAINSLDASALALKAPLADYENTWNQRIGKEAMAVWETRGFIQDTYGVVSNFSTIEASRSVDTFKIFSKINIPVHIWQGTKDEVIVRSDWERLESLCDGTTRRFTRVENADHSISEPYFDDFLQEISRFLVSNLA